MAASDPVPPFAATVDGVRALLPDAQILDTLPPGRRGVTAGQVAGWLAELSGRADLRLTAWRRLRAEPTDIEDLAGEQAPRARFEAAMRDAVHNGAASYTEAARFPERAALSDTSYAAVLWARYTLALAELEAWMAVELDDTDADDTAIEPGHTAGTVAFSFPPVNRWERVRW